MNTLTELNNYGQTSLTYTDNRAAAVIFDRPSPDNQNYNAAVNETHQVPVGINITEIIKPEVKNVFYEIDVTGISGATVSWPTIPSGCTVTNPSTGIYRLNFINDAATWEIVKRPNISVPGRTTNFTYTPKIKYESSQTKSWSVFILITVKIAMTSAFTIPLARLRGDMKFTSAISSMFSLAGVLNRRIRFESTMSSRALQQSIAIAKKVFRSVQTSTSTLGFIAQATKRIVLNLTSTATITSSAYATRGAGAGLSSSVTTAAYYYRTWTSSYSAIYEGFWNAWQRGRYVSPESGAGSTYTWISSGMTGADYAIKQNNKSLWAKSTYNNSGSLGDGRIDIYNYASSTWSLENAFTESPVGYALTLTNATKASPVRITLSSGISSQLSIMFKFISVSGMTELNGNWYYGKYINSTTFDLYTDVGMTVPLNGTAFGTYTSGSTSTIYYTWSALRDGYGYGSQSSIDSSAASLFVASGGGIDGRTDLFWYSRTGSSWSSVNSIRPNNTTYISPTSSEMSGNGSYTALGHGTSSPKVSVFNLSGTWSSQQVITLSSYAQDVSLDYYGNYLAIGCYGINTVYIYSRSGSTWSLEQTIVDTSRNIGYNVHFNEDATLLLVSSGPSSNRISLYAKSGSTWNFVQWFTPDLSSNDTSGTLWSQSINFGSDNLGSTIQLRTNAPTVYRVKTLTGI